MIIMTSVSIKDLAKAINEKRYLTPDEIKTDKIINLDKEQKEGEDNV